MILNPHEKETFCEWLSQQINSTGLIVEQMEKMGLSDTAARFKKEISACITVRNMLTSTETQTI